MVPQETNSIAERRASQEVKVRMGAERERTSEGGVMELCIFYSSAVSGICSERASDTPTLFSMQDIGLNGKAEYLISIGVIYSLPWQRLIFFSLNGLFYRQLCYPDDFFGCFYAYLCWKLKSKTILLFLNPNRHSPLWYYAHNLGQESLKLLPSTW